MLTPSQTQWLHDQKREGLLRQSEMIAQLVGGPASPSPLIADVLARSSDSSPAPALASSDSAASSHDEGSDIGRIRDVVLNPRYVK